VIVGREPAEAVGPDPPVIDTGSTRTLPPDFDVLAPDGSEVRILLSLPRGSMAHFRLRPGQTSQAVRHRTVEEIWYILSGQGEMWRSVSGQEAIVPLASGTCLTIPTGVSFQFRSAEDTALAAVAITMPPWPAEGEAEFVPGNWKPTDGAG
jgi:mannose-6-phosphate isomerase-like protein (cupin superfamily)